MKTQTIISLKILGILTIITGIIYPLFMTGIAQVVFPHKANGSLIKKDGIVIGSELIGQKFDSTAYFWPRPSAIDYNPLPSSGSNLGPTSDKLKKLVMERKQAFISANMVEDTVNIPSEMVFASASGLDPHISPKAALLQVERIVKARNLDPDKTQKLIKCINDLTESPQFLCLGEERINVLLLNLALDKN
jgi:potassium-transporting ATPase KdpC subunit